MKNQQNKPIFMPNFICIILFLFPITFKFFKKGFDFKLKYYKSIKFFIQIMKVVGVLPDKQKKRAVSYQVKKNL